MNADFIHEIHKKSGYIISDKTNKKAERYCRKHELCADGFAEIENIVFGSFADKMSADSEGYKNAQKGVKYIYNALKIRVGFIKCSEGTRKEQDGENVLNENIGNYAASGNFSDIFYALFFFFLLQIKL